MKMPHRARARFVHRIIVGLFLLVAFPCSVSLAQTITSSGLNTTVSSPIHLPSGQTQFDITGGTRPGGGANLFHSFGDFNVLNNNIANFLNDSGLATSNILGRVTGGNVSNIFGTIQTTGFGNANLFLMNPTGFLFGPNATVNVGGMVTFTSADYLRLADNTRFNAIPHTAPDLLLSAAPVAAFGFLGSNPGAITVQGSQLSVADGTGISLVGGNMTVQGGTLTAPSGDITLVSVGRSSNPNVGGEVVVAGSGPGSGFTPTGFRSLGTINLSQGSTLDTSVDHGNITEAGSVLIRGGQFVMDDSSIKAEATLGVANAGHITFNVGTFSVTDSAISAKVFESVLNAGTVTIQGLQGSGTFAHSVSLTNTEVATSACCVTESAGPILIRADHIALNQSTLDASAADNLAAPITLVSRGGLDILNSRLVTTSGRGLGDAVDLSAGTSINLTGTIIDTRVGPDIFGGFFGGGGSITMAAPIISLRGSTLEVGGGSSSTISLTGTKAVSLTNGSLLSADSTGSSNGGGTIQINGGAQFTSQQSTISAREQFGNGGTIHVEATTVKLTDTQVTTSTSGGPETVGGHITVDAKHSTLINSQILSSATEGHGGTIDFTSPIFKQDANSVIDASSQSSTNGTVTINGVIQP